VTAPDVIVIGRLDAARQTQLLDLLATAWWTTDLDPEALARMLEHSDVLVGLVDRRCDALVGFARAITDRTLLAIVLSVIVHPDYRGLGLGARLMDEVLQRPEIADVESIELVCQPDLTPFYERWGFTDAVGDSRLMRRTTNGRLLGTPGGG
jgi:GNAT superfamily N-acetyltransferase